MIERPVTVDDIRLLWPGCTEAQLEAHRADIAVAGGSVVIDDDGRTTLHTGPTGPSSDAVAELAQAMRDANDPDAWHQGMPTSLCLVPFHHFARVALDWMAEHESRLSPRSPVAALPGAKAESDGGSPRGAPGPDEATLAALRDAALTLDRHALGQPPHDPFRGGIVQAADMVRWIAAGRPPVEPYTRTDPADHCCHACGEPVALHQFGSVGANLTKRCDLVAVQAAEGAVRPFGARDLEDAPPGPERGAGATERAGSVEAPNLPSYGRLDGLVDTDPIGLRDIAFDLVGEIERLRAENAEYRAIFDLGYTRCREAEARWRAEDPEARALVMPDLGRLVEWLMAEVDRARAVLDGVAWLELDNGHLEARLTVTGDVGTLRALAARLPAAESEERP